MIVANIFSGILNSVLSSFASGFAQAATSFLTAIFQAMTAATSVRLSGTDFVQEFDVIFGLALVIAILLALIELAAGALSRDHKRVTRVPLNLVLMIVGTIVSVGIVNTLLQVADGLCVGLLQATHFNVSSTEMGAALAAVATEPAVVLVMAGFIIAACIAIYLSLIARQVLILIAAVLAPLAFSGTTSKWTAGWWKRWAEMMLGLIFSKVVLTIILITGFKIMAGMGVQPGPGISNDPVVTGIGSLIGGVGLLMAGAFAPMFAMKMIHFTGGQFEGAGAMGHHFFSAATSPIQKAGKVGAAYSTGGATAAATTLSGISMGGASKAPTGAKDQAGAPQDARPSAPPSSGTNPDAPGGGTDGPRPSSPPSSSGPSAGPTAATAAPEQSVSTSESAPPQREAAPVANTPDVESPGSQQREIPNEPATVLAAAHSGGEAPSVLSRVAKAIAQQRSTGSVAPPAMVQAAPQSLTPSSTPAERGLGDSGAAQASLHPSPVHSDPLAPNGGAVRSVPSAPSEIAHQPGPLAPDTGSGPSSAPAVPSSPTGVDS